MYEISVTKKESWEYVIAEGKFFYCVNITFVNKAEKSVERGEETRMYERALKWLAFARGRGEYAWYFKWDERDAWKSEKKYYYRTISERAMSMY